MQPPRLAQVVYDYVAANDDELSLRAGRYVLILSQDPEQTGDLDWWYGQMGARQGLLPANYVRLLTQPAEIAAAQLAYAAGFPPLQPASPAIHTAALHTAQPPPAAAALQQVQHHAIATTNTNSPTGTPMPATAATASTAVSSTSAAAGESPATARSTAAPLPHSHSADHPSGAMPVATAAHYTPVAQLPPAATAALHTVGDDPSAISAPAAVDSQRSRFVFGSPTPSSADDNGPHILATTATSALTASSAASSFAMPHAPSLCDLPRSSFTLGRCIGGGSFGRVYHGSLTLPGARTLVVAVKELTAGSSDPVEFAREVQEYYAEAELLSECSHINIAQLYGVCVEAPTFYMVMEFCAGGALSSLLASHSLEPRVIVDWALQIARGMNYLHAECRAACVVHRDLKSSNILLAKVGADGKALLQANTMKIADFGLARRFGKTTHMTVAGTFAWMAPEVIRHSTFSRGSDVWSYGVLLWELLTSQVPYADINIWSVAYNVGLHGCTLPVPNSCPSKFASLMRRCWSVDPRDRPSFAEIMLELQQLVSSEFTRTSTKDFFNLQEAWRAECAAKFKELHKTEKEIQEHALKVQALQETQASKQKELDERERQLAEREKQLLEREHRIRQQQQDFSSAAFTAPRPANRNPWRRHHRRLQKSDIGVPQDFVHFAHGGHLQLDMSNPLPHGGETQYIDTEAPLPLGAEPELEGDGAQNNTTAMTDLSAANNSSLTMPTTSTTYVTPTSQETLSQFSTPSPGIRLRRSHTPQSLDLRGVAHSPLSPTSTASPTSPKMRETAARLLPRWSRSNMDALPTSPANESQSSAAVRSNSLASTDSNNAAAAAMAVAAALSRGNGANSNKDHAPGAAGHHSRARFLRRSTVSTSSRPEISSPTNFMHVDGGGPAGTNSGARGSSGVLPAWMQLHLSREEADKLIWGQPPGAFVVRRSATRPDHSVLVAMRDDGDLFHGLIVQRPDGKVQLGEKALASFSTLAELVNHHQRIPILCNDGARCTLGAGPSSGHPVLPPVRNRGLAALRSSHDAVMARSMDQAQGMLLQQQAGGQHSRLQTFSQVQPPQPVQHDATGPGEVSADPRDLDGHPWPRERSASDSLSTATSSQKRISWSGGSGSTHVGSLGTPAGSQGATVTLPMHNLAAALPKLIRSASADSLPTHVISDAVFSEGTAPHSGHAHLAPSADQQPASDGDRNGQHREEDGLPVPLQLGSLTHIEITSVSPLPCQASPTHKSSAPGEREPTPVAAVTSPRPTTPQLAGFGSTTPPPSAIQPQYPSAQSAHNTSASAYAAGARQSEATDGGAGGGAAAGAGRPASASMTPPSRPPPLPSPLGHAPIPPVRTHSRQPSSEGTSGHCSSADWTPRPPQRDPSRIRNSSSTSSLQSNDPHRASDGLVFAFDNIPWAGPLRAGSQDQLGTVRPTSTGGSMVPPAAATMAGILPFTASKMEGLVTSGAKASAVPTVESSRGSVSTASSNPALQRRSSEVARLSLSPTNPFRDDFAG